MARSSVMIALCVASLLVAASAMEYSGRQADGRQLLSKKSYKEYEYEYEPNEHEHGKEYGHGKEHEHEKKHVEYKPKPVAYAPVHKVPAYKVEKVEYVKPAVYHKPVVVEYKKEHKKEHKKAGKKVVKVVKKVEAKKAKFYSKGIKGLLHG